MDEIKICSPFEMYSVVKGRSKAIFIWCILLPIFMLLIIWVTIQGIENQDLFKTLLGVAFIALFGWALWFCFRERKYRPGKSFLFNRGSNTKIKKLVTYVGIFGIIVICLFGYYSYMEDPTNNRIYYYLSVLLGIVYAIYYTYKSFNVHEDVDFVTLSDMGDIIGVEIGEKIKATYQNFDSSTGNKLPKGANLMIISDKKIYFSFFENGEWFFVKKNIIDISKFGILDESSNHQKLHLILRFSDGTNIILHMEAYNKATSNSYLFFRKFLEVLDAVVLGIVDEKISSRRRVSVNQETKSIESQQSENREVRSLDLSETVMEGLRNATPVESGRVLEL